MSDGGVTLFTDFNDFAQSYELFKKESLSFDYEGKRPLPKMRTMTSLSLTLLWKNMGSYVPKEVLSGQVQDILGYLSPDVQAPRHLSDSGWDIVSSRYDMDFTLGNNSVAYKMCSLGIPEDYNPARRIAKLPKRRFARIVDFWGGRCASCGARVGDEGVNGKTVTGFDQGHLNPDFPIDFVCGGHINCVPQCPYCNRSHKDDVEYAVVRQPDGSLRAVAIGYRNPELERKRRVEQGAGAFDNAMEYNRSHVAWRIFGGEEEKILDKGDIL